MASGERVVLSGASLTDIVLKWTPTEKHGNTVYRYEVLIDTIGGDFTKPVETIFSDNNGLESQLTLTHYQTTKSLIQSAISTHLPTQCAVGIATEFSQFTYCVCLIMG